jgi:hypothetical protein
MIEFANLVDITANSSATPIIFAYIDPGTGSILLQYLIAALIGGSFFLRKFIGKIFKSIFNLFKKGKSWVYPVSSGKANGIPVQSFPPLFQPFRDQGYNTNMLGYYLPYASLLPGKDLCHIPLCIKLPEQLMQRTLDSYISTAGLGEVEGCIHGQDLNRNQCCRFFGSTKIHQLLLAGTN